MIAACSTPTVVVSPSPTALPTATPTPAPSSTPPRTGDAEFFFEPPGPMQWCGVFASYRPPSGAAGELKIGATTFAASSGNPAAFDQRASRAGSARATGSA